MRNYALVTAAYWAFTLTDGALRMVVLLHFHALGYSPVQLAFLFLFYELFGVVTNLLGGFAAARFGLKRTLTFGLWLQAVALVALALVQPGWAAATSVAYVMGAQALSGIAKDLTKMSAKSSVKVLVPAGASAALFKWVAVLTGSKNALKGAGFFLGGLLLALLSFQGALFAMAAVVALVGAGIQLSVPSDLGRTQAKATCKGLLSKNRAVNVLSAARCFLGGARDVWFVVGVPVFLSDTLKWSFAGVGAFLALWVIGYGAIQSLAPLVIRAWTRGGAPEGRSALVLALLLAAVMAAVALTLQQGASPRVVLVGGLGVFGAIFALNSAVHSYLILAYSEGDKVAMNVGFYYMANAAGRLMGTLLSGLLFQQLGLAACLWASFAFALATAGLSLALPRKHLTLSLAEAGADGGD
ncbi:MAG: transporter permease [Myxococcaceae bacterium]|nr:transporter permease [Myxococcaceae bacterium]